MQCSLILPAGGLLKNHFTYGLLVGRFQGAGKRKDGVNIINLQFNFRDKCW